MDSLNTVASINAILVAAGQVSRIVRRTRKKSVSATDILTEIEHIEQVFRVLQGFLEHASTSNRHRAVLIQIQDVIAILTQMILTLSEFQTMVEPLFNEQRVHMGRITHSSPREPAADYFVNQIRRQRTSSSLLLQVIQCRPDLQAQGTADALHQHVNKEIEANPDLMAKLARIQLPSDAAKRRALGEIPSEEHETAASDAENITSVKAAQPREVAGSDAPEVDPGIQPRYHIILTMRGLSDQVNDQSANAVASTSTSRAHSWSALSGISLAETSILTSTILPLSEPELNKFRKLVAPVNRSEFELRLDDAPKSMFARSNQYSRGHLSYGSAGQTSRRVSHLSEDFMKHYGLRGTSAGPPNPGSLRRINKELNDMNHDPPSSCAAGPTGDDLYNWEGTIMGPGDTPYSGGVFFVSIRLPGEYPFHPPHIIFKTRVYHPNIDSRGRISADILGGSWCTTWTIAKVLLAIGAFLDAPDADNPLVPEIAHVYRTDRARYNIIAKEWTRKYAI